MTVVAANAGIERLLRENLHKIKYETRISIARHCRPEYTNAVYSSVQRHDR